MKRVALIVCAALVLAAPAGAARWPLYFPTVTALASKVAGHPVDIYCVTQDEWETDPLLREIPGGRANPGYAWSWTYPEIRDSFVVLRWDTCGYLLLFIQDPNERSGLHGRLGYYGEAEALLTVLHEANHLRGEGEWNEGRVECRALRSVRRTAVSLGADRVHADKIKRLARRAHALKPPAYRTIC
jgi:hypothetical protein